MRLPIGPGTLVTAAFIGPGTVTVCTLAGVQAGYTLLWALLFSTVATFCLQEMTGRLGLVTQSGLGEALRSVLQTPLARLGGIALVLAAVVLGNAAYQGGNVSGATLGVEALLGNANALRLGPLRLIPLLIGALAFGLLWTGHYRLITLSLLGLVLLMSLVFLTTALAAAPDWGAVLGGLLLPRAEPGDWLLVIALIGTTVVPYNLFLHAALTRERYGRVAQLPEMRLELLIAIALGGLISMSVVISSAATLSASADISSAADMAIQLEPLLGSWATLFLGAGLFAAGLSSAITAPLAAAFAAAGILGWREGRDRWKRRLVWQLILAFGIVVSSLDLNPVLIIQFAQVANGILLPVVVAALLFIMNRRALLAAQVNSPGQNLVGFVILAITVLIGLRSLNNVFSFIQA